MTDYSTEIINSRLLSILFVQSSSHKWPFSMRTDHWTWFILMTACPLYAMLRLNIVITYHIYHHHRLCMNAASLLFSKSPGETARHWGNERTSFKPLNLTVAWEAKENKLFLEIYWDGNAPYVKEDGTIYAKNHGIRSFSQRLLRKDKMQHESWYSDSDKGYRSNSALH